MANLTLVMCFVSFDSMISDALKLFRKIGDEKAIGIACNNLGNTLHAVCKQQKFVGECCNRIPGICALNTALQHYDESILIAQNHLNEAFGDEQKAEFTQQMADRMFNRAMFLLLIASDKCAPPNARMMALSDIEKVRRMDDDVKDFWYVSTLVRNCCQVWKNGFILLVIVAFFRKFHSK